MSKDDIGAICLTVLAVFVIIGIFGAASYDNHLKSKIGIECIKSGKEWSGSTCASDINKG